VIGVLQEVLGIDAQKLVEAFWNFENNGNS